MSDSLDPVARRVEAAKAANERIDAARAVLLAAKEEADAAAAELNGKLSERNPAYEPFTLAPLQDTEHNRTCIAPQLRNAGHTIIFENDPDYRPVRDAELKYRFAQCEYDAAMKARLPEGWEGDMHGPDFIRLADVETWLKERLSCLRSLRGFRPTEEAATALAGCDIRNFFRVLQHLGIWNLPERPEKPTDAIQAEETLSDLLAWVCRQLPDDPGSGLFLFTGQGIATLGQLRVALLSEEQNAPPPDMFQRCSGDQRRVLEMLETHKELTGDFRSLPAVQRAESICRQRYGQPLRKDSLDRIRCEYHYETGNPFRVANNERIGRVLDVVEQIPLRAYPAALVGLPDQQPAVAPDPIVAEFEHELEACRESAPTITSEGQAAAQRWQSIGDERQALERFAEQKYRQDLLDAGFTDAEIGAGNHVRHVEGDDPRKPAFHKANLEHDRRIKAIGPWLQKRYAPPATEPLDQAPLDQAPLDQAPLDQAPLDQAPLDQAPLDHEPPATGSDEQGEGAADAIPTLPARCFLSMKAMLLANATSADKSMTAVQIARKAEGQQANPESFKRPLSTLKKHGYTDSKKGADGGCWLTVKGIDLAKKL